MIGRVAPRTAGLALASLVLLAQPARAEMLTGLERAQPTPQQLAPGLAVSYTYGVFNHIDHVLAASDFEPGEPLPAIDSRAGSGKVLTSKTADEVGAIITGFIRFRASGTYGFNVTSNDGVRVEIGGKLLYEDPYVHPDDTSRRIEVQVDEPGWYPIRIAYFEKRYTSTLILRWAVPGQTGSLAAVPAEAFGHLKK